MSLEESKELSILKLQLDLLIKYIIDSQLAYIMKIIKRDDNNYTKQFDDIHDAQKTLQIVGKELSGLKYRLLANDKKIDKATLDLLMTKGQTKL